VQKRCGAPWTVLGDWPPWRSALVRCDSVELWVQDGAVVMMAIAALRDLPATGCILKNNSLKKALAGRHCRRTSGAIFPWATASAQPAQRFTRAWGGALKDGWEQTRKNAKRSFYERPPRALRKSAGRKRRGPEWSQHQGVRQSVTSLRIVYG